MTKQLLCLFFSCNQLSTHFGICIVLISRKCLNGFSYGPYLFESILLSTHLIGRPNLYFVLTQLIFVLLGFLKISDSLNMFWRIKVLFQQQVLIKPSVKIHFLKDQFMFSILKLKVPTIASFAMPPSHEK